MEATTTKLCPTGGQGGRLPSVGDGGRLWSALLRVHLLPSGARAGAARVSAMRAAPAYDEEREKGNSSKTATARAVLRLS
jgi:hypothetical protein